MGRAEVWPQTVLTPSGLRTLWRVVEVGTSRPCDCWLPGHEPPDPEGVLDRGGFDDKHDAQCFAAGVCWERAYHGLLPGVTTADVDRERAKLDGSRPLPALDDLSYPETAPALSEAARGVPGAIAV